MTTGWRGPLALLFPFNTLTFNLSMIVSCSMVGSKETNMAANNFYGFPHAGAQYGYMKICISIHVL